MYYMKAKLPPGKKFWAFTEEEDGCLPKSIWMMWKREKSLTLVEVKSQFLGHPASSLVSTMTQVYQLLNSKV
jgi:hypothetical protein